MKFYLQFFTVEKTIHYLLQYPNFSKVILILFNKFRSTDNNINVGKTSKERGLQHFKRRIGEFLFGGYSFNDIKKILF